jgi:hypothetical protein
MRFARLTEACAAIGGDPGEVTISTRNGPIGVYLSD